MSTTCKDCGHELQIGDYPFCPHGSIYPNHAQRFDPTVLHRAADGTYSFPGFADGSVHPGYERVEIRTLREADRITREINQREDTKLGEVQAQSEAGRQATRARNQAFMNHVLAGGAWTAKDKDGKEVVYHGLSAEGKRMLNAAREYLAQKDQQRSNTRPRSTNFHIDVFSNDSSNRERYSDARTNWRSRKG